MKIKYVFSVNILAKNVRIIIQAFVQNAIIKIYKIEMMLLTVNVYSVNNFIIFIYSYEI